MAETAIVIAIVLTAAATLGLRVFRVARPRPGCDSGRCADSGCPLALRARRGGRRGACSILVVFSLVEIANAGDPPRDRTFSDGGGRPPAAAAVPTGRYRPASAEDQHTATLGGPLPWLAAHGVTLAVESVEEVFGTGSGDSGSPLYAGFLELGLELDLAAVAGWGGASAGLALHNTRGAASSEAIEAEVQGMSSIAAPALTQLAEYWLARSWRDGARQVKIGRQDANVDFAVTEAAADHVHASFGMPPTVPLPAFPAPALGVAADWRVRDRMVLRGGLWDGASEPGAHVRTARAGILVAGVEAQWRHAANDRGRLGVRLGGWQLDPLARSREAADGGRGWFGGYLLVEGQQRLASGRDLGAFLQLGTAPAAAMEVTRHVGLGAVLAAPLPGRPHDAVGVGLAHAERGAGGAEAAFELYYRAAVTRWLDVQPDLRLLRRPGGRSGSVLVAGVRIVTRL